jgi:hypothetical protein
MVETIIIPEQSNISLDLPLEFVGKKIKILMYSFDEIKESIVAKAPISKMASLRGTLNLSPEQSAEFHQYIDQSRSEWETNIS